MNQLERQRLDDGREVLVKHNPHAVSGFFQAEAAGLRALGETGWRVPEVIAVTPQQITLERLRTARPGAAGWRQAGHNLARQHAETVTERFGFDCDTFCGDSRQPNDWRDDGFEFYREQRYRPQVQRARDAGLLDAPQIQSLEALIDRLDDWLPNEPPALLHGDLWSGNLLFDTAGEPVLIDPAVYYGWPEADLAMTHAFGGFAADFYQAYREVRPLEPGFEQRLALYNLYHWLNHLNLFGGTYLGAVLNVLQRYR